MPREEKKKGAAGLAEMLTSIAKVWKKERSWLYSKFSYSSCSQMTPREPYQSMNEVNEVLVSTLCVASVVVISVWQLRLFSSDWFLGYHKVHDAEEEG